MSEKMAKFRDLLADNGIEKTPQQAEELFSIAEETIYFYGQMEYEKYIKLIKKMESSKKHKQYVSLIETARSTYNNFYR